MILLLGATGYVGSAFARELTQRGVEFIAVRRSEHDYYQRDALVRLLRETKTDFLINAAGYTGKPNVDACEDNKGDCLLGNAVLPSVIRQACELTELPWMHISSGCIYSGARKDGTGFTEQDAPNFCFRSPPCSFYSGTKALGEECLQGSDQVYIHRLRIPFDHRNGPRNYLSKLMRYERLLEATNSISHLGEFVRACLESWQLRIPYGTYNVTNPNAITTREVTELIRTHLPSDRDFQFFRSEAEFMEGAAIAPRSNCILDSSKLLATGIKLTPAQDAIRHSLRHWQSDPLFTTQTVYAPN